MKDLLSYCSICSIFGMISKSLYFPELSLCISFAFEITNLSNRAESIG